MSSIPLRIKLVRLIYARMTASRRSIMRSMRSMWFGLFSAALLLQGATNYKVQARYPVPGTGGWEYVTLESPTRRLFLSPAAPGNFLDARRGKPGGTNSGTPGAHRNPIGPALQAGDPS